MKKFFAIILASIMMLSAFATVFGAKFASLFVAIALFLSLSVVAYAHPGGTDSDGGHTNHSTGESHSPHGYPEHQHYDIDGDGDLDCPYKTAVITKPQDETTPSSNDIADYLDDYEEVEPTEAPTELQKEAADNSKGSEMPAWLIGVIVLGVIFGGGFVWDWISNAIKRKRKK